MKEKYVYGVIEAGTRLPRTTGIGRRKLSAVSAAETAAIVSDVTPPLRAGKDELMTHARVLQRALDSGTVLPMRFGMVMPDEEAVREQLLEPYSEELREQLEQLAGLVEVHLRAVYDETALMEEVVQANSKVSSLGAALQDKPADATYYERIELGQEVAQTVESVALQDREAVLDALEGLAVAVRVNDPNHERVACDAAFLVEERVLAAFDRAVDELGGRNQGRLQFSYTGPHPAYSFVELPVEV